jgi:hypothetical protein
MSSWAAALVAAATITLTYFFCVRPMLAGRGQGRALGPDDAKIAELREELRALRAPDSSRRQPPQG